MKIIPQLATEYDPAIINRLLKLGRNAGAFAEEARRAAEQVIAQAVEMDSAGFCVFRQRLPAVSRHVLREMFVQLWRRFAWPRGDMSFTAWDELVVLLYCDSPPRMFPGRIRAETNAGVLTCRQC